MAHKSHEILPNAQKIRNLVRGGLENFQLSYFIKNYFMQQCFVLYELKAQISSNYINQSLMKSPTIFIMTYKTE